MSQLIRRLRGDLASAVRTSERIELAALLALQLARAGLFEEARQNIVRARSLFEGGHGGTGTIWVMLAEAIIHLFEQQSPQAKSRISAAQALAVAIKHPQLIAITSAWKAHIQFEDSDFIGMLESLTAAVSNAMASDHDAQARIAMVFFTALSSAGDLDKAQTWFLRAHNHAVQNGDQASIDALLYNKAAFVVGHLRVLHASNRLSENEVKRVRLEFLSSQNLNLLTGISALANHLPFVNSRLLMLEGKFEEASNLLNAIRYASPFSDKNFNQSYVDLEICFCNYKFKKFDAVQAYLKSSEIPDFDHLDIDENIVAIWMRSEMADKYSQFGCRDELKLMLDQLCANYLHQEKRWSRAWIQFPPIRQACSVCEYEVRLCHAPRHLLGHGFLLRLGHPAARSGHP